MVHLIRRNFRRGILILVAVFFLHSVFPVLLHAQKKKLFESLPSSKTGVNFRNVITETTQYNALTYENLYNGGGIAVGDINNDGLDDIYFVSNMQQNKLYLNLGNFKFKDITSSSGTAGTEGWKSAAVMVDINGDNLLDIYVCYSGKTEPEKRRNKFFINRGDLTFIDRAAELGLDDNGYSTQAAFLDYDRDGDLDLFLLATNVKVIRDLEYAEARKAKHPYAGDKLFRNDNEKFVEVTEMAGILSNALGFGLGVAVSDLNKDGWPDIYVSNDYAEPDYLYVNNKDGTFSNRINEYLKHISQFSMGCDIADINNDLLPDIFTADMLPEDNKRQKILYGPENYEQFALMVNEGFHYQHMRNMLHINNGNNTFSEIGQFAGVSNTDWSWAPLFADYDNDGWKDLFVTNGYFRDYTNRDFLKYKGDYYFKKAIAREKADTLELVNSMTSTPVHNYIFRNTGGVNFQNESKNWGFDKPGFSNGAAYADLDNDGDLDLIVNNQGEEASIFRNLSRETNKSTNYLDIRLKGSGLNTRGFGCGVTLYTNGKTQFVEQMPARGYQSSVSDKLHFGLGATANVDSIKILWLSGLQITIRDIQVNQTIDVVEEKGTQVVDKIHAEVKSIFQEVESPLAFRFQEYGSNDFKRQPLLMTMLSPCGPVMATGDVNGDNLEDIFVGGAKESPGKLFLQAKEGLFSEVKSFSFKDDFQCTDADAVFFDADNDADLDLYIVSGGYHDYKQNDKLLQDRLYLNDSKGNFVRAANGALPLMTGAKSCVRPCDFDKDGDIDLFVGGRVVTGLYPAAPDSYLLQNDGTGHFSNVLKSVLPDLTNSGMVTDAVWMDVDKDEYADLLMCGEFMPLRLFVNRQGRFEEKTDQYFSQLESGLWNRLAVADFDKDGDLDFLAGNFGLNSQLRVSDAEPLSLTFNDFDKNGSVDPILVYYNQGKPYPFPSRDELLDQIISLRKKFPSYASYSEAGLTDIFSKQELNEAKTLVANQMQTLYFENSGDGKFLKHFLPKEAQYSPVHAITILDHNDDGNLDFLLAGNQTSIRLRLGVMDANYGQLYTGDGRGNFSYVTQPESGLSIFGDVRSMKIIRVGIENFLFCGLNTSGIIVYKLKTK